MSVPRYRVIGELIQVKAPGWDGLPTYLHVYKDRLLPEGVAQDRIAALLAEDMIELVEPVTAEG